jgi:8-hydroxy-5-deazaflavin:NADPH oxidoreductase
MKIGILGTGPIGTTLVRTLSAAGHDVKVANSRGPHTIDAELFVSGARAVTAQEAVQDVDAVILSIPFHCLLGIAPLISALPDDTVVIDTSNYYAFRDGKVDAIENGQVESQWVQEQLRHPIAKAWNAILAGSFANKGTPKGTAGRIAIPVAADRARDREVAMALVNDSGLDAFDAGPLETSWRLQPGAPAYCTDLTLEEVGPALAAADRAKLSARRDLYVAVIQERLGDTTSNPDEDWGVRVGRVIFM